MKTLQINVICIQCYNEFQIMVDPIDFENYTKKGTLIQVAFPYLKPGERELIQSQTCGECFDKLFKDWVE